MIADIGEITETHISWFLDDSSCLSFTVTGEYPEELRIVYSFAECGVSVLLYESHDITTLIEIITRYYDEFSHDMSLECEDRSTGTRLFSLLDVVYLFTSVYITKILPETF